MIAAPIFNTKGAARRLGCSETWIHKLVSAGKLKAYTYDTTGMLVERQPDQKHQGRGLYFSVEEVDAYCPAVKRRPRGSKNKRARRSLRRAGISGLSRKHL